MEKKQTVFQMKKVISDDDLMNIKQLLGNIDMTQRTMQGRDEQYDDFVLRLLVSQWITMYSSLITESLGYDIAQATYQDLKNVYPPNVGDKLTLVYEIEEYLNEDNTIQSYILVYNDHGEIIATCKHIFVSKVGLMQ